MLKETPWDMEWEEAGAAKVSSKGPWASWPRAFGHTPFPVHIPSPLHELSLISFLINPLYFYHYASLLHFWKLPRVPPKLRSTPNTSQTDSWLVSAKSLLWEFWFHVFKKGFLLRPESCISWGMMAIVKSTWKRTHWGYFRICLGFGEPLWTTHTGIP